MVASLCQNIDDVVIWFSWTQRRNKCNFSYTWYITGVLIKCLKKIWIDFMIKMLGGNVTWCKIFSLKV